MKMEYKVEEIEEICIAGIKTITDNAEGMTLIPQIWERFFSENILDRIENKTPGSGIHAVYTDYESDETGIKWLTSGSMSGKAGFKEPIRQILSIMIPLQKK
jgi:predicted transcriptional regulator YdeE